MTVSSLHHRYVLEHLHRAKRHLREAVAETVSRRKVPDLMFQISAVGSA